MPLINLRQLTQQKHEQLTGREGLLWGFLQITETHSCARVIIIILAGWLEY